MNILVTGCMGFIGSNLVPKLLCGGHHVIGFDNLSNPSINPTDRMKKNSGKFWNNFKFYKIDISNPDHMKTILLNERRIDTVIHLAAVGSVPRSYVFPMDTMHNNCTAFASILYTSAFFRVKKFVYASSSSVYGDNQDELKTEGQEGNPLSPYALSKQVNEKFVDMWGPRHGINCIGLRFFNVYGPGQKKDGPYASVIPKFLTSEKPVVYGDGTAVRDFTYVDDVCEVIDRSINLPVDKKKPTHTILNCGKGAGTTVLEILCLAEKEEDAEFKEERHGDIKTSVACTDKLYSVLKYVPSTTIHDGLMKTKTYYDSIRDDLKSASV